MEKSQSAKSSILTVKSGPQKYNYNITYEIYKQHPKYTLQGIKTLQRVPIFDIQRDRITCRPHNPSRLIHLLILYMITSEHSSPNYKALDSILDWLFRNRIQIIDQEQTKNKHEYWDKNEETEAFRAITCQLVEECRSIVKESRDALEILELHESALYTLDIVIRNYLFNKSNNSKILERWCPVTIKDINILINELELIAQQVGYQTQEKEVYNKMLRYDGEAELYSTLVNLDYKSRYDNEDRLTNARGSFLIAANEHKIAEKQFQPELSCQTCALI